MQRKAKPQSALNDMVEISVNLSIDVSKSKVGSWLQWTGTSVVSI